MGKNKRKLIEWVKIEQPPEYPSTQWGFFNPRPYHLRIDLLLSKPETRIDSFKIASILVELIIEATQVLKKRQQRTYQNKTNLVKSLRYVYWNFYFLEEIIDTGVIPRMDHLDYAQWIALLEILEHVGFEFPRIKRRLLLWRLQNEHGAENSHV